MPLHEDRIRTLEARVRIPDGEIPGTYLTRLVPSSVASNEDAEVGWTSPPDQQVLNWHGSPDGTLVAAKGDLCIDLDTPGLYQNTDGQQAWSATGAITSITAGTGIDVDVSTPSAPVISTDGNDPFHDKGNCTGSVTVTLADAPVQKLTLTGNVTLTLSGSASSIACDLTLYLFQDSTGSRTITWPASVKWPSGVAPSLSTAASKVDIIVLETIDNGTTWYANLAGKSYA